MKLEQSLNIDIIEEKPVLADAKEEKLVIDKDDLLADVPLDDSDNEVNNEVNELDMGFVMKPKPDISDIFDDKPVISEVADEVVDEVAVPVVKIVKEDVPIVEPKVEPKKQKKKRKPMSEEHKAKLAISREKALARRKYLAEQRKIEKAQAQLVKDQEQLLHQKEMEKKIKDLKIKADSLQEPSISEKEPPVAQAKKQSLQGLSLEQIEQVQLNAIISYEAVRKKRKAEKRAKQQEDKVKQDIMNTIKKAEPSWFVSNSPYNNCF